MTTKGRLRPKVVQIQATRRPSEGRLSGDDGLARFMLPVEESLEQTMNAHDQSNTGAGSSNAPTPASSRALGAAGIARRRLFQGGAAGAGILLSTPARSALNLTGCESPSAAFSGNLSRPVGGPDVCGSSTGGRSPGYWAQPQHFPSWPNEEPTWLPTFYGELADCSMNSAELKKLEPKDVLGGKAVVDVFGFEPTFNDPSIVVPMGYKASLWTVIAMHTLFQANNNGNYLFHLAAMYLNASVFSAGSQMYPMRPDDVVGFAKAIFLGLPYCPGGGTACDSKPAWTAAEVKEYVDYWTQRYDDNAALPNLCKKNTTP